MAGPKTFITFLIK